MASCAATADADPCGIDVPFPGIMANVANGGADIGNSIRDLKPRAAAMSHKDQCVTSIDDFFEQIQSAFFSANYGFRRHPCRDPAPADHEQDCGSICILTGSDDVVRQGHPGLVSIDHVRSDGSPLFSSR